MMILTSLFLAHILGDFIIQPNKWVKDKEDKKAKSKYLYLHGLIHILLIIILLWDYKFWWVAILVGVLHICIDALKLHFQNPFNRKEWFFYDQLLHILVIVMVIFFLGELHIPITQLKKAIPIITAFIFLTTPTSMIMKILLSNWAPNTQTSTELQKDSLQNAGKYIGILERILVFLFILTQHWEGVGFMIAAKSVFRFSDLAEAKQRKLTEYVLIGTLLSFGIAILCGIIVNYLLNV